MNVAVNPTRTPRPDNAALPGGDPIMQPQVTVTVEVNVGRPPAPEAPCGKPGLQVRDHAEAPVTVPTTKPTSKPDPGPACIPGVGAKPDKAELATDAGGYTVRGYRLEGDWRSRDPKDWTPADWNKAFEDAPEYYAKLFNRMAREGTLSEAAEKDKSDLTAEATERVQEEARFFAMLKGLTDAQHSILSRLANIQV